MNEEKMKLPNMEKVNIIGGLNPRLMEIADPAPFLEKLTRDELWKVINVGIKYQNKLIEVEIGRLKVQADALNEVQKVINGFM
jgi:hypothetical protein